ncbi:MAG: hypothetical protein CO042_01285 [Parcubacteria group bacterium CG_4_9_14_0_2_um_filter_41_8]|nr:MAG: hypothetical protein AUJ34_02245 [Parcubacteria group bacterium CG1_02_41_12]PIP66873.1 MAG: hypothetical protein COW93_03270 [Parcubacteria group bacterium CG22_combo_CG10-13_8_21_14_all_41_9]PIQ78974.1 MAG: hypothetical protein COV79_04660 [Parcubacteria group bacterium CG11_big_fil_rev_8_21_14_0_20_41_14]PIR57368.1 MAG: hypothetical protein COU72_01265 [Parcubacteria group bacterium CG10_big_fil_rev_8_21_14_0_10_41_35]PIZ82379.1 MAG: hypothetical protein COY02_00275 [Parcubacteria gr
MKKNKNKSKAITLIEIMVVIAILGIIASITAGFIKYYQPNIQLTTEIRKIRSDINEARERTISEQIEYIIVFNKENNQYSMFRSDNAENPIFSHILNSEISFLEINGFTQDTVGFNKSGATIESGYIILQNSREQQKTITINPSGYVYTQ